VSAGDTDFVRVVDVTSGAESGWFFDNQATVLGTEITVPLANSSAYLPVTAGDVLEFQLWNTNVTSYGGNSYPGGIVLSSNPADSDDGINHAYATSWPGGNIPGVVPAEYVPMNDGTPVIFMGMEDLPLTQSDLDYNDDQLLFDNVNITPEPGSFLLLSTGLLSLAGLVRRKLRA
jgi:hypothetical protein